MNATRRPTEPNAPHQTALFGLSERTCGFLAGGIVVLCWSGFNIVSRLSSKGVLTPFDLAAMRFTVSGLISLPIFLYAVPVRDWPRYLVLAIFGGLGYALQVYSGFAFAPSAHAGVSIKGGIPFCTVVMLAVTAWARISCQTLIAMSLSAYGLLLMRRWQIKPQLAIIGIASFAMVLYMPVYLAWLPKAIEHSSRGEIILQCVYQGLIAALLAAGMYSYANQKIGASQASMMLALVPGVSAIGAFFLLDEALGVRVILGVIVVSVGAIVSAISKPAAKATSGAVG